MKMMKRVTRKLWPGAIAWIVLSGCGRKPEIQKQTRFLMDTVITIQIPGGAERLTVIRKALDRMEEIDHKFNVLDSSNQLFAFNHRNEPITDPEIVGLVKTALDVARQTDGAFDVTVYPLVELWGFFGKNPSLPADGDIRALLPHVGWRKLIVNGGRITKNDPAVRIDLGGIAKGYAVGEAVKTIRTSGIRSALVDAGGDIYAVGTLNGKPWKIGIRDPRGDGVFGSMDVTDLTVVTSGDYERYFMQDGVRYHHILNPKTGYPVQGLRSATIITADAALGDGLSTAVFVLGKERGAAFLEKSGLAQGVIIDSTGAVTTTRGFDLTVENKNENKANEPYKERQQ
jgi:thiamine biosynthesis lipoprotein